MSLYDAFSKRNHFSELDNPLDVRGVILTPTQRRDLALQNLTGNADIEAADFASFEVLSGFSEAELQVLDGVTPGTGIASKALILDASGFLAVAATSASTDGGASVEPISLSTTMTGAGGVGGRAKFALTTEVELGGWANALKGITDFGDAGAVTGLGSGIVAELVLGGGCAAGSYAPLEVELGLPTGALTGTRTSLMSLNVYGDDAGAFDDSGFLFDLNGVAGSDPAHMFDEVTEQAVNAQARLRVQVNGTVWYIPLCDTAALS
jgi:hypothetical protein